MCPVFSIDRSGWDKWRKWLPNLHLIEKNISQSTDTHNGVTASSKNPVTSASMIPPPGEGPLFKLDDSILSLTSVRDGLFIYYIFTLTLI